MTSKIFRPAYILVSATGALKFETALTLTLAYIILTFTSFSITQLENLLFISTYGQVMHEWGIDRKLMGRRFQKYNFQAGPNSSLCYKGLEIR
jgi:hypothetical protein